MCRRLKSKKVYPCNFPFQFCLTSARNAAPPPAVPNACPFSHSSEILHSVVVGPTFVRAPYLFVEGRQPYPGPKDPTLGLAPNLDPPAYLTLGGVKPPQTPPYHFKPGGLITSLPLKSGQECPPPPPNYVQRGLVGRRCQVHPHRTVIPCTGGVSGRTVLQPLGIKHKSIARSRGASGRGRSLKNAAQCIHPRTPPRLSII